MLRLSVSARPRPARAAFAVRSGSESTLSRRDRLDDGPVRFDPNVEGDHHHAVCRVCGTVDDIGSPSWADAAAASGFVLERVEVIVRGLCRACAAA